MRLPLARLEVFNAIASAGSIRAAADQLGLRSSTVSHQLKSLEEYLGAALFIRTTRSVQLTEAGRALQRGTLPAFDQLESAVRAARDKAGSRRGLLRINLPEFAYALVIEEKLTQFCTENPDIELELSTNDALVDLAVEGFHAGIRLCNRIQQDMISVPLTGPLKGSVLAERDYEARFGKIHSPRDLLNRNCIRYRYLSSGRLTDWEFSGPDGDYTIAITGNSIVNSLATLISQVERGVGLGYTFSDYAVSRVENGSIICLLHDHQRSYPGLHLYFPREYRQMESLQTFISHFRRGQRTEIAK